jgi:hypothetical protein
MDHHLKNTLAFGFIHQNTEGKANSSDQLKPKTDDVHF